MRWSIAAAVLLAILCPGCDSGDPPLPPSAAAPAKGRITHRGKPLTGGRITLEPTDGGREAKGDVQPDGTFVLTTFQEGDGALPGVHRVSIAGVEPPLRTRGETHVRVSEGKTEYHIDLK
ncbi:hypothetical protein [Paludisphaera mucosa]|uniref:Carboxypeptidase regulatory-like domain-containing protein n=1 Tax=Paludisphaera mucosa TaxID=3030827 RepID=A0ABT6FHW9_9BACT|nr:hypothetical protein [Paludisphaera mucosa]MDG3007167.1 hypothetical protein [Paludisphaera mucosa]